MYLGGERSDGCADEGVTVVQVDGDGDVLENLAGLVGTLSKAIGNHRGVDALVKELGAGAEHGASNDDDACRSITSLNILRL